MRLMKKTVSVLLFFLVFLSACSSKAPDQSGYLREYPQTVLIKEPNAERQKEYRGIWFSYLDYSKTLSGLSKEQFEKEIISIFAQIKDFGFNTVIFQVLPHADALYESEIYPTSALVSGEIGGEAEYDPLEIACQKAHQLELNIEAWINPFRAYAENDADKISTELPFGQWYQDAEKKGDYIVLVGDRWYYNPCEPEVRKMIASGVKEIAENYDVDGIHIDDYFYPTTEESFDEKAYLRYGGTADLAAFRRECVSEAIREMYSAVKEADSSISFGISPQGNLENCYNKLYADVYKWAAEEGYADYIMPQLYYSFKQSYYSFSFALDKWKSIEWNEKTKLCIGLSAYKLSGLYTYSTEEEKNDWATSTDMLARQLKEGREVSNYGGMAVFAYSNLFPKDDTAIRREKDNLKAMF